MTTPAQLLFQRMSQRYGTAHWSYVVR